ncbi:MAG: alkaline phosphatase family protein [Clostridia bacterium]|nr:alkaline phosphatase family protein [Clostridia bacterium]
MSFQYEHVILIGIDGAGNFYRGADTPTIHRLMEEGAGDDYCLTSIPTDSAECWGSMLIGVYPEKHGMTNGTIDDTPYKHGDEHPTVYKLIREAIPDAVIDSFSHWNPINTSIADPDIGIVKDTDQDGPLTERICDFIINEKPTFLFIQFDSIDGAGHKYGYNTPLYLKELHVVDGYAAKVCEAVEKAGIADSTLIIATADHGGIGTGHGGKTDEEKYVFFAATGKTVKKGKIKLEIKDIPAIICRALGIPADPRWDAKVPDGMFTD